MPEAVTPSMLNLVAAPQYVRMSTEHQQCSTENQGDAILRYANAHGMQIVRTYSDEGKSGLSLSGRRGLRELLQDVENGRADYSVILVYDIGR
jgi:DNA invertase Pin-like site-specific DNA recombinase